MTRDDLITELRCVIDDTLPAYGWSDTRLINWLSEGQDKFCEKTGFWSDKSTYAVTTVLNLVTYPIPERIIAIRSVWDGVNQLYDLSGVQNFANTQKDFFGENWLGSAYASGEFPEGTLPNRPYRYRTDLETGVLSLLEPPIANVVLKLRVHRRSKVSFATMGAALEIPEQFHLAVVEYGAFKAFNDHDRELQDPVKATDHLLNFNRYVKEGQLAYRRLTGEYTDVIPNPLYVV